MSGTKGTATTVVDKLPGYVKNFVYSGTYEEKDGIWELDSSRPYGKEGYLPWADDLARDKDYDDLWLYKDDNGNYISTYAEQDEYEISGISNLANRGRDGDSLIKNKAIPYIEGVLDGDYLTGTKAEFITMLEKVTDKPKGRFEEILDGIGTSLYVVGDLSSRNLAKEVIEEDRYYDRIAAFTKAQNYKSERRRQEHAISYGVEYGKQAVVDAEILRMAGLYQREYDQGSLTDVYKRQYNKLVTKVRRLEILGNAVRALVGSQEAETKPYYRASPAMGIVGGAVSGASMGAMVSGGNPYAIAIGAVVGAVAGYISSS